MINSKIKDINAFIDLLNDLTKFTAFVSMYVSEEKSVIYSVNYDEFPSSRVEIETDLFTLIPEQTIQIQKEKVPVKVVKVCLDKLQTLRNTLNSVISLELNHDFSKDTEMVIGLDLNKDLVHDDKNTAGLQDFFIAKSLNTYKYTTNVRYTCISPDATAYFTINKVVRKINYDFAININVNRFNIIQQKVNGLIDGDSSNTVFIYPNEEKQICIEFGSRINDLSNNIKTTLALSYEGNLNCPSTNNEIVLHKSSYDIMNLLRLKADETIRFQFSSQMMLSKIESKLKGSDNKWFINCIIYAAQIKPTCKVK